MKKAIITEGMYRRVLLKESYNIDGVWYHGTNAKFDKFNLDFFGKTDDGWYGRGIYFHSDKDTAEVYGRNVIKARLNYKKSPLILPIENSHEYFLNTLEKYNDGELYLPESYKLFSIMKIIKEIGKENFSNFISRFHDAMIVNYVQGTSQVIVFNPDIIEIVN
jgi:hypothetical protein